MIPPNSGPVDDAERGPAVVGILDGASGRLVARWRLRASVLEHQDRQGMGMGCIGARATARSGVRPITSVVTALTSGALLLVGACTPSPQPTPTSTTSPTVSTSPTGTTSTTSDPPTSSVPTTDPGIPPAARVDSIEGAQEFVKYFLVQLDRSWAEPNPALLAPLCSAQSKTCQDYIYTAQEFQSNGWRYQGGTFAPTSIVARSWISGSATVLARGSQPTGKIVDSNGSTIRNVAAMNGGLVFDLSMQGSWTVQSIKAERPPT